MSHVPGGITDKDRKVIIEMGFDSSCKNATSSFQSEIQCIVDLKKWISTSFLNHSCDFRGTEHEIDFIVDNRSICCFDIARLLLKTLSFYGLKVRHIALFEKTKPWPLDYFSRVSSHAVVEVKTSKGWMLVDTTSPYIALKPDGSVLTLKAIRRALLSGGKFDFDTRALFEGKFHLVYGLYSRHGMFFPPFIPLIPDIDWAQFSYNFWDEI